MITQSYLIPFIALSFCFSFAKGQRMEEEKTDNSITPASVNTTTAPVRQRAQRIDKAFTLYPNPSEGKFKIDIEDRPLVIENTTVEVCTEEGKIVYIAPYKLHEIDIATFSKGTYLIKVGDGETKYINKVIIQ